MICPGRWAAFDQPPKLRRRKAITNSARTYAGESKLDAPVLIEYPQLVLDKLVGNIVPARLIIFGGVGLIARSLRGHGSDPIRLDEDAVIHSLVTATLVAMTSNVFLNNSITYPDRPLKGWSILTYFVSFCSIYSFGAFVTVVITDLARPAAWYLTAIFAGMVTSVWNSAARMLK